MLNEVMREYNDWKTGQRDKISSLEDVTGEKADIVRRLEQLESLKVDARGTQLLEKMEEIAGTVCLSTSEAGSKSIESEVSGELGVTSSMIF